MYETRIKKGSFTINQPANRNTCESYVGMHLFFVIQWKPNDEFKLDLSW